MEGTVVAATGTAIRVNQRLKQRLRLGRPITPITPDEGRLLRSCSLTDGCVRWMCACSHPDHIQIRSALCSCGPSSSPLTLPPCGCLQIIMELVQLLSLLVLLPALPGSSRALQDVLYGAFASPLVTQAWISLDCLLPPGLPSSVAAFYNALVNILLPGKQET